MRPSQTTETDRESEEAAKRRIFGPRDFAEVLKHIPDDCPLVGGQAVAWWADVFALETERPLTSSDIDFWGFREDVEKLAAALNAKPVWPHQYEMTVWVGGIPLKINGELTVVDFINTVPGLDVIYPEKASVNQSYAVGPVTRNVLVLSPVSLVLAKLHALKAFDQANRQDKWHLRLSLAATARFLENLLRQKEIRVALWNVERILAASQHSRNRKLEQRFHFDLKSAVPIAAIERAATDPELAEEERGRLNRFLRTRWPRLHQDMSA